MLALVLLPTAAAHGYGQTGAADLPPIVVTLLPAGTPAERQGPRSAGMLRADFGEGARLVVVAPGAAPRVLSTGFQSACDADVSWDGKRVLFAGRKAAGDAWNIFEIGADGAGLRQITHDLGDCRSPRYLPSFYTITEDEPWDQVAFVVTRGGERNEFGDAAVTSLYTTKLDGSFVQRLTYNLSSDYDPLVTRDGRLLFSTWHRATLDDGLTGRIALEGINTDGSDRAAYVGRAGKRIQHMPCVTETGLAVFVEADAVGWDGSGTLGAVEVRRPLHSYRSLTGSGDGLFHSPSALPDGQILVSRRPADGKGTLGVVRLDPTTRKAEVVFDDPAYHEVYARALISRPRADGRSSVVSGLDSHGELYCLNAYTNEFKDRSWLPAGTIKALRVIEGIPSATAGPGIERTVVPSLSKRRILAEVPIGGDGSFHLTVPANTPVQLQLLDDRGLALRSCGWIWARSHQAQGCIGCHEDPERTPDNRVPDALKASAVSVGARPEKVLTVDFRHEVAPTVVARCLPCHGPGASPPRLNEGDPITPESTRKLFEALMAQDPAEGAAPATGRYVQPGSARTSSLVWHILGRNTSRPWDGPATSGMVRPVPDKPAGGLTPAEVEALIRWIDLGAAWDARTPDTKPQRSP